jgi:hypothetical protein
VSDVTFTAAHLTVLTAVLGPLLTAIAILFKALLAAKDAQIKSSADVLETSLETNRGLTAAVAEATKELRDLRGDLWKEQRIGGRGGAP